MLTKCLSIRWPWTLYILYLGKDIENRDWKPKVAPGRFFIQTSTKPECGPAVSDVYQHLNRYLIDRVREIERRALLNKLLDFDLPAFDQSAGHVVGSVECNRIVTESQSPWFIGKYGFVLQDPRPLEPNNFAKVTGKLNFFKTEIAVNF